MGYLRWMFLNLFRRFVLLAIAVPLAAFGARKLSDAVERRRGPNSRATRLLRQGADTLQGFRRPKRRRFSFR
ncbi:hypothetical protein ODJ79_29060 [Actinoplanes sp. KI2]|uniref:hypothetical protein n=1 Tax=Actinoplanes sp. KI2 TaxID=2983315 RepID=UPI0021D5A13A|nr:hypothetical protein [Actinoplanes sp. KI2]MCU7727788.1 hypothetical protein [Actinoplanes sp. KI2]